MSNQLHSLSDIVPCEISIVLASPSNEQVDNSIMNDTNNLSQESENNNLAGSMKSSETLSTISASKKKAKKSLVRSIHNTFENTSQIEQDSLPRKILKTNDNNDTETLENINNESENEQQQQVIISESEQFQTSSNVTSNSSVSSSNTMVSPVLSENIFIIDGETEWNEIEQSRLEQACGTLPVLIVDLDNTLVHSDIGDEKEIASLQEQQQLEDSNITFDLIGMGKDGKQALMVKIRPFLKEFLTSAFQRFNVVMYTLGSHVYARAVHGIFKKLLPEVFEDHDFIRIIASQTTAKTTNNNNNTTSNTSSSSPSITDSELPRISPKKQLSKYFPINKFFNSLLILDDNKTVYENEWMNHVIYTKPYHFWHEIKQGGSDSFLLFTASLLEHLTDKSTNGSCIVESQPSLAQRYVTYKNQILKDQVLYVCPQNPCCRQVSEIACQLGAQMYMQNGNNTNASQSSQQNPLKIVVSSDRQYCNERLIKAAMEHNYLIVTDSWLKFCYILNCRQPTEIFEIKASQGQQINRVAMECTELELARQFTFKSTA